MHLLITHSYDATSSILQRAIRSTIDEEPYAKRTKLTDAEGPTSVASLVNSHAYTDIDSFYRDIKTAIASISTEELGPAKNKISKFEDELDKIIQYELGHSSFTIPRTTRDDKVSFVKKGASHSLATNPDLVLTTNGIAHGSMFPARRLYSSLRFGSSALNEEHNVPAALDLDRLPPGITASSVRATKGEGGRYVKAPTLSQLFPTSKHLKFHEPPRPSSNAATKGQSISWSQTEPAMRPSKAGSRVSFYNQFLSSGHWLSYNVSPPASQLLPSSEKRKQRDRALSTGEAKAELTGEEQEETRLAREARQKEIDDALFKSAYSSFAPTHDDAAAVVPQKLKSRLWWDKYGYAKPLRYFADYNAVEEDDVVWKPPRLEIDGDEPNFEDMVNNWEDIDTTPLNLKVSDGVDTAVDGNDKDADELLQEVSDMLETLSSYQRNRNLSSSTKQQGPATQSKSSVELTGDSSTPSNAETLLYETLKSQLTLVIATLPPFTVAKLDGEKLSSLNISTKVVTRAPIHKGTLSNQKPGKPTQPSVASATPVARPQSGLGSRTPSYQQQVSTPANRTTLVSGRPSAPSYSTSNYRTPNTTTHNNAAYMAQQQLSQQQQPQRISYSQYGQTPATTGQLTNGTRPLSNGYTPYGQKTTTPSAGSPNPSRTTQLQRPAQPNPQQRPQSAQQQMYSNYNINMHKNGSPPQAVNNYPTQAQRSNHATPGQTPARSNWNPSDGTIGSMFSAEEVQTLENRQKMQMAAQHAQIRQGSGTPQPPRPTSVHSNGTPVPLQNGEASMS